MSDTLHAIAARLANEMELALRAETWPDCLAHVHAALAALRGTP